VHVVVNGEKITATPSHPFYSPVKGWTIFEEGAARGQHLLGRPKVGYAEGSNIVFYLYDADGSPIGMAARPAFCKFLSFAHGEDAALPVDFLSPNTRFVSYRQFCIII
jgi:hypothetical protein